MKHFGKNVVMVAALIALGAFGCYLFLRPRIPAASRFSDGEETLAVTRLRAQMRLARWEPPERMGDEFQSGDRESEPFLDEESGRIFFTLGPRGGDTELWMSEPLQGAPPRLRALSELNSAFAEQSPCFDHGWLYFASNRPGGAGGLDLYRAQQVENGFLAAESLGSAINSESDEDDPAVRPNTAELYFASNRASRENDDFDLYRASIGEQGFGVSSLVEETQSAWDERSPSFDASGSVLVFASNRHGGKGGFDLYRSLRRDADHWFAPENLGAPNSTGDDSGPAFADGGFTLYFDSDRDNSAGAEDLYVVHTRELFPLPQPLLSLTDLTILFLLALIGLLAWLARRWATLEIIYKCLIFSLVIHLLFLWMTQRVQIEVNAQPVQAQERPHAQPAFEISLRNIAESFGESGNRERGTHVGEVGSRERGASADASSDKGESTAVARATFGSAAPDSSPDPRPQLGNARANEDLTAPSREVADLAHHPEFGSGETLDPLRAAPESFDKVATEAPGLVLTSRPLDTENQSRSVAAARSSLKRGAAGAPDSPVVGAPRSTSTLARSATIAADADVAAADAPSPKIDLEPHRRFAEREITVSAPTDSVEVVRANEAVDSLRDSLVPGPSPSTSSSSAGESAAEPQRAAVLTGGMSEDVATTRSSVDSARSGDSARTSLERSVPVSPDSVPERSIELALAPQHSGMAAVVSKIAQATDRAETVATGAASASESEGLGSSPMALAAPTSSVGGLHRAQIAEEWAPPAERSADDAAPTLARTTASEPPVIPDSAPRNLQGEPQPGVRLAQDDSPDLTMRSPLEGIHPRITSTEVGFGMTAQPLDLKPRDDLNLTSGPRRLAFAETFAGGAPADLAPPMPVRRTEAEPESLAPERREADSAIPRYAQLYERRFGAEKQRAIEEGGGSVETEKAVYQGLRYLASVQRHNGSFGDQFDCTQFDKYRDIRVGKTGLALLAFLGAGHTTQSDTEFSPNVRRAIGWIFSQQDPATGHFGDSESYSHGIATYAIAECYAITKDQALLGPLARAVQHILDMQVRESVDARLLGGWPYYYPHGHGDDPYPRASISSWQVMALESARIGGLDVPESALILARQFFTGSYDADYGYFRYTHNPEWVDGSRGYRTLPASNPASIFVLTMLGAPRDESLDTASRRVIETAPERYRYRGDTEFINKGTGHLYYWYYATLAMFFRGGEEWHTWNEAMKRTLLPAQEEDGSWRAIDPYSTQYAGDDNRDRSYTTSLCVLCLEVYYRYFTPLLQRQAKSETQPPR